MPALAARSARLPRGRASLRVAPRSGCPCAARSAAFEGAAASAHLTWPSDGALLPFLVVALAGRSVARVRVTPTRCYGLRCHAARRVIRWHSVASRGVVNVLLSTFALTMPLHLFSVYVYEPFIRANFVRALPAGVVAQ